jgi:4-amino-4-deoxy-L-arabinose transferase-like glycosyltransferase
MSPAYWRIGLLLLALFTLGKSLVWVAVNPPFNSGDETAHLQYVMQLRNTGQLPVFKFAPDCSPGENSTPADPAALQLIRDTGYAEVVPFTVKPYESYQPPLYYLVAALVALPLARDDALGTLYASRVVSALLVTATVIIAAFAVRELTLKPWLGLVVGALLASLPTFGFFGGLANTDNMLNLFAAATTLAALWLLRTPRRLLSGSLLLGALAGGALLSKVSGLALVPVGLLAIAFALSTTTSGDGPDWWRAFLRNLRTWAFWRRLLVYGGLYAVGLLVVAGWWMARNVVEYGDLTATANHFKYGATCWGPTIAAEGPGKVPAYLANLAMLTPFSFIANFGWGDEHVGRTFYFAVILPLLLVDIFLGLRWLTRHAGRLLPFQQQGLVVLGVQVFMTFALFISFNFTVQYQPVGRYLFMAVLPITGFLAIGLLMPFANNPRVTRVLLVAALAGLTALTIGGYLLAGTGWMAIHTAERARGYVDDGRQTTDDSIIFRRPSSVARRLSSK